MAVNRVDTDSIRSLLKSISKCYYHIDGIFYKAIFEVWSVVLTLQGVSDGPIATISDDNYMLSASQAARLHSGAVKIDGNTTFYVCSVHTRFKRLLISVAGNCNGLFTF